MSESERERLAPHPAEGPEPAGEPAPGRPGSGEGPLVLIADDEEAIVEVVGEMVAEAGADPLKAAHGREALELARARRPALVITDLMMPYLSGAQLIAALRADAAADGQIAPPVIVMTAVHNAASDALGADAVLRKPFELGEVQRLLHRFLGPPRL
jgi:two-component system, sensor histidine kinase and response regulator